MQAFNPLLLLLEHDTVTNSSKLNGILRGVKNTWQNDKSMGLTRYRTLQPNRISIKKNGPTFPLLPKTQYSNKEVKLLYMVLFSRSYFFWDNISYYRLMTDVRPVTQSLSVINEAWLIQPACDDIVYWIVYRQIRSKNTQANESFCNCVLIPFYMLLPPVKFIYV